MKMFFSQLSLKYKILFPIILTILLAFSVFASYLINDQRVQGELALQEKSQWVAELLANSSAFGVWNIDDGAIKELVKAFSRDKEIILLRVLTADMEVLGSFEKQVLNGSKEIKVEHIISYQGEKIGRVTVALSNFNLEQNIQSIRRQLIVLSASIFLITSIITIIASRYALRPLNLLMSGVTRATARNLPEAIVVKSEDELGKLTHAFNQMSSTIFEYQNHLEEKIKQRTVELQAANQQLTEAMDALWGEMALAKKIQTVLVPDEPYFTGFDVSASLVAADEVGGDYFDIIHIQDITWVVIGDVSGHGVPAGLIMMMVQTSIHTVLLDNPGIDSSKLLTIVNQTITMNIDKMGEQKYMTIMVLAYNNDDGAFYHSGLHEDIVIYRAATDTVESIESSGMWLGMVPDITGMMSVSDFRLDSGDSMLLYTDGITEAVGSNGEMFDNVGLEKELAIHGKKSAAGIHDGIINKINTYKINDDVALLVIKKE